MSLLTHPEFLKAADHHKAGRFDEAARIYQSLIEENPNDPDLWHFKGLLALHRGQHDEAIRFISLAIVLKPGVPDYFHNIGLAYHAAGNVRKAAESFNKQGNALQEQCRFADSLPAYDAGLSIQPDFAALVMNRGAALDRLGRYAEADASFASVLRLLPEPVEPGELLNVANALSGLGHAEEAIAMYDRLLALEPDNATAHCSKALLHLRLGQLAEGWRDYEWRWVRQGGFKEPRGYFRQPVWHGESPQELGGPLLVIAEQGFGDVIQFARYVPLLAQRGYDVIFETLPELTTLFREGFDHPRITVVSRIEAPLEVEGNLPFAAWVGVMSLPERFGTTLETIPADVPYLSVDAGKVEQWAGRIAELSPRSTAKRGGSGVHSAPSEDRQTIMDPGASGFALSGMTDNDCQMTRIGLVWAGNPRNLNDFARSIPSELLAPLLAVPGVEFYSLQKGPAADYDFSAETSSVPSPSTGEGGTRSGTEWEGFAGRPLPLGRGECIKKLGDELTDFTETTAVILNLDLVIAVDTSVAHLAGALGKPVWLMIPAVVDWRWLNQGSTTNWYPTMRIFRQTVRGDWNPVIAEVARELTEII